jgi:nicotinamide-nucleotide amidase
MADHEILIAAGALLDLCRRKKLLLATAESCTGGLVAGAITDIAGASDVFDRGFVTYSNAAKEQMLGVPAEILRVHGAVSRPTAEAMAHGVLARSDASIALAITGIAGPGGGTATKPVGLVHFVALRRGGTLDHRERRYGDIGRSAVRAKSVLEALRMLIKMAETA